MTNVSLLYFVDRASCCDSWQMTNLTHNSFLCIHLNSLHVSSNLVLIIRRINFTNTASVVCHCVSVTVSFAGRKVPDLHTKRSPTQSDIYHMLYWYNWFSWWWARGSKHVENWKRTHRKEMCIKLVTYQETCPCL